MAAIIMAIHRKPHVRLKLHRTENSAEKPLNRKPAATNSRLHRIHGQHHQQCQPRLCHQVNGNAHKPNSHKRAPISAPISANSSSQSRQCYQLNGNNHTSLNTHKSALISANSSSQPWQYHQLNGSNSSHGKPNKRQQQPSTTSVDSAPSIKGVIVRHHRNANDTENCPKNAKIRREPSAVRTPPRPICTITGGRSPRPTGLIAKVHGATTTNIGRNGNSPIKTTNYTTMDASASTISNKPSGATHHAPPTARHKQVMASANNTKPHNRQAPDVIRSHTRDSSSRKHQGLQTTYSLFWCLWMHHAMTTTRGGPIKPALEDTISHLESFTATRLANLSTTHTQPLGLQTTYSLFWCLWMHCTMTATRGETINSTLKDTIRHLQSIEHVRAQSVRMTNTNTHHVYIKGGLGLLVKIIVHQGQIPGVRETYSLFWCLEYVMTAMCNRANQRFLRSNTDNIDHKMKLPQTQPGRMPHHGRQRGNNKNNHHISKQPLHYTTNPYSPNLSEKWPTDKPPSDEQRRKYGQAIICDSLQQGVHGPVDMDLPHKDVPDRKRYKHLSETHTIGDPP